jgi:hypothetical protein
MMRLIHSQEIGPIAPAIKAMDKRRYACDLDLIMGFERARRDDAERDSACCEDGRQLIHKLDAMHTHENAAAQCPRVEQHVDKDDGFAAAGWKDKKDTPRAPAKCGADILDCFVLIWAEDRCVVHHRAAAISIKSARTSHCPAVARAFFATADGTTMARPSCSTTATLDAAVLRSSSAPPRRARTTLQTRSLSIDSVIALSEAGARDKKSLRDGARKVI